jgi:hypothetical protein
VPFKRVEGFYQVIATFNTFMHGPGWAVFSLIAAVFSGGFYLVNQYLRQPGHALVFWMRVIVVVFMTPLVAYQPIPQNPMFYVMVLLTALLGIGADVRTFNVSAKYGGGVVSRVVPMVVWGSFFLWFAFHPHLIFEYMAHPLNTAAVLAALGGCVYFSIRLNRCEVSRAAMIDMLPALLAYTVTTVLNKEAMTLGKTAGTYAGAVYFYMYVQSLAAVLMLGPYTIWHDMRNRRRDPALRRAVWRSQLMIPAALLAALVWICHMIYKNYAMAYTPNPAYQMAVNLTTPVFISIFYYFMKHREESDVLSGMGIVVCAIILALVAI